MKKILIIGGDLRQLTAARLFQKEGFSVKLYGWCEEMRADFSVCGPEEISEYDVLLFPMPMCIGNNINAPFAEGALEAEEILKRITPGNIVLGGKIPQKICGELERKNIKYTDYLKREELAVKNALVTAEGALEIAIRETPVTVHNSKCVVTGYGRIAKILSGRLRSLGAAVTVAARRTEARAEAETEGMRAVETERLGEVCEDADIVFNTVPAMLFDERTLNAMNKNTLLIDLASKPGGVDFESAKKANVNVIWALSLPGKTAPVTSGKIIFETIMNILKEPEV